MPGKPPCLLFNQPEEGQKPPIPPSALPSRRHAHTRAAEHPADETETITRERTVQNIPCRNQNSPFLAERHIEVSSSTAILSQHVQSITSTTASVLSSHLIPPRLAEGRRSQDLPSDAWNLSQEINELIILKKDFSPTCVTDVSSDYPNRKNFKI